MWSDPLEEFDERDVSTEPFFSFLPESLAPLSSLAELSGPRSTDQQGPAATSLMRRVARGWDTSLRLISCEDVCTLVGQNLGLQWLAEPVASFVIRHPKLSTKFYPGDMTKTALQSFSGLFEHAPAAARMMLEADFVWMDEVFGFNPDLVTEAKALLADARALARAN